MITPLDRVKAVATAAALEKITGGRPDVVYMPDHAAIRWSDAQERSRARDYVRRTLTAKPGTVRVEFAPIITPEVFRLYGVPAAAIAAAIFVLGRVSK